MLQGRPVNLGELIVPVNPRNKKISHVMSHHFDGLGHAWDRFLLNGFRTVEFALLGFSFASLRRTLAGRESQTEFLGINLNEGKASLSCPNRAIILRFGHTNRLESGILLGT